MDARLLKRFRKAAKKAIKLVPFSDGSMAIWCGKYEWHWDHNENNPYGFSWQEERRVFINTTFNDKEKLMDQYENAIHNLICTYAERERGRRKAEQLEKEVIYG